MRFGDILATSLLAATAAARSVKAPRPEQLPVKQEEERFLVEFEHGRTKWITEEQKWEFKRVSDYSFTMIIGLSNEAHTHLPTWSYRIMGAPPRSKELQDIHNSHLDTTLHIQRI